MTHPEDLLDPDTPERRALLDYLRGQGCTVEEMRAAHARGRLFALAGDRQVRPVVGLLSPAGAAAHLGCGTDDVRSALVALGLPRPEPDEPALAERDLDALRTALDLRALFGATTADALLRVLGASVARITEAESAALRATMRTIDLGRSGSELVTAQAYAEVAGLVPRLGRLLDAVHRLHLETTRAHFDRVDREVDGRAEFVSGVGFADLCGFTRLSRAVPLHSLGLVLSAFESTATALVHGNGGRVVKFVGDAVMWVSDDREGLVRTAHALVTAEAAAAGGFGVRAGIAFGRLLAQDGDWFGPPVNLAARLVDVAAPGEVVADAVAVEDLEGWVVEPADPVALRGWDEPVVPHRVRPGSVTGAGGRRRPAGRAARTGGA